MIDQDSDDRKANNRLGGFVSDTNVKQSSNDAEKGIENWPSGVGGGDKISQSPLISGGRGEMLRMLGKESIGISQEKLLRDDVHEGTAALDDTGPPRGSE